jgi:hypothetical protein
MEEISAMEYRLDVVFFFVHIPVKFDSLPIDNKNIYI